MRLALYFITAFTPGGQPFGLRTILRETVRRGGLGSYFLRALAQAHSKAVSYAVSFLDRTRTKTDFDQSQLPYCMQSIFSLFRQKRTVEENRLAILSMYIFIPNG